MIRRGCVGLLLTVLVCGGVRLGWASEESKSDKDDYYQLYKVLVDAMDQVERNYVKDIDRRELVEAAIEGIVSRLDPYSSYISPDEISQFRGSMESEFGGIGIRISGGGVPLQVASPLVGTPAYRAGLIPGDRIVEINGEPLKDISRDEAIRRLKGKPGTEVKLSILHPGKSEKVEVTIVREIIHVDTVLGDSRKPDDTWDFMLKPDDKIGYLRVSAFSRGTAAELRRALEELQAAELKGLILDVRFNPGGLLSSAIEVSDLFISEGRIVSTEGRNSLDRTWDARKEGTFEGFPMVVLVNRYSASASEIVSACLQDHQRAIVIGERTWGKGSVQNVIELEDGKSALKLTTAGYRRPSGKNIHRFRDTKDDDPWGVTPEDNFKLRLGDAEMFSLMEDRRQRDVLNPNHNQPQPPAEEETPSEEAPENPESPETPETPETPPFVDRQLQKAIEHLTTELAKADPAKQTMEDEREN